MENADDGTFHLRQQQYPAARRIIARNTIISKASAYLGAMNKDSVSADQRLGDQFRYYRKELIEAATLAGVTVPLDIVEDTSGRIVNFVKHNGPKRKLPENEGGAKQSLGWMSSMEEAISTWAASALDQISDGSAVSTIVILLTMTHVPSVQELTLTLLGAIVSTSEDAALQMFHRPNAHRESRSTPNQPPSNPKRRIIMASLNNQQPQSESANQNPTQRSKATMFGLLSTDTSKRRGSNMRVSFSPKGPEKPAEADTNTSNAVEEEEEVNEPTNVTISPQSGSCLSLMLSIAALHRNSHMIMAGCAEVIAVLSCNPNDTLSTTVAMTPTCELSKDSIASHNSNQRSSQSSRMKEDDKTVKESSAPRSRDKIIEWAGIKILVKFLSRFMDFRDDKVIHFVSVREKEEMTFAFGKVLVAVLEILCNSREALTFVTRWHGASTVIQSAFQRVEIRTPLLQEKIEHCIELMNAAKEKELESHSSLKYPSRLLDSSTMTPMASLTSMERRSPMSSSKESRGNVAANKMSKVRSKLMKAQLQGVRTMSSIDFKAKSPEKRPNTASSPNSKPKHIGQDSKTPMMIATVQHSPVRPKTAGNSSTLNVFFANSLPSTPCLPKRLEHQDIAEASNEAYLTLNTQEIMDYDREMHGNDKNYNDSSIDKIANIVISRVKQNGAMFNGKSLIPLEEKYRRVYSPTKPSFDFDAIKAKLASNSSTDSRPTSSNHQAQNPDVESTPSRVLLKTKRSDMKGPETIMSHNNDMDEPFMFLSQSELIGFKYDGIDFERPEVFDGFRTLYDLPSNILTSEDTMEVTFMNRQQVAAMGDTILNSDDMNVSIIPDENVDFDDGDNAMMRIPDKFSSFVPISDAKLLAVEQASDIVFHS